MQDRLRLKLNPPNVAVPANSRDLYIDANGDLVKESPGGVSETIGSFSSSTGGLGTADAGKSLIFDANGSIRGISVIAGEEAGDFGLDYCGVMSRGSGSFSARLVLYKVGLIRALLEADSITASRTFSLPDISGRVALTSTTSYADDAAAATAGLAIGDLYFTGTKFRVRVS